MPAKSKKQLKAAYASAAGPGHGPMPMDVGKKMIAHTPDSVKRRLMRAKAHSMRK